MMPHEEAAGGYGYDVHDAATGELLVSATGTKDNGRGLAADFIPSNRGYEFWSSADGNTYDCATGKVVLNKKADTNFRIYWTGDPYDQTFDGHYNTATGNFAPSIQNYNTESKSIATFQTFSGYGNPDACNTTKATPCLQADLLGDWREELVMFQHEDDYTSPTCKILIYSTPEPTDYKVPCLMEDHVYRMGIVWQNSSYNQPPHLGYYLPDYLGIDGATYVTQTKSHAPEKAEVEKPTTGAEELKTPAEDKGIIKGICYTAGENGEVTASTSNGYIKMRTNNNGGTITFSVNEGYRIVGINVEGYSNNASTTADRSIYLTGVYVDGAENSVLASQVTLPGGIAGQSPVTIDVRDIAATKSIKLVFDNSNITTSDVDSKGKNKQIMARITFTYEQITDGIKVVRTAVVKDGKIYNLMGQQIENVVSGQIYICNGKKFVAK